MALFDGLTILGLIGIASQFIKEKTEPKLPPNVFFNRDKLHEDIMARVPDKVVEKRLRQGYYHTEKKMFDIKKYNDDVLAGMSPDELESRRKSGVYGAEKPIGGTLNCNYTIKGISGNYVYDVERYEYCRRKYPESFANKLIPHGYQYGIDPSVYRQYM